MCNNICAAVQHKQFYSTTSHTGLKLLPKVSWRISWPQTCRRGIVETFLKAFLSSLRVLVDTSSPRPLTATLIKLFSSKRFVLTGSLSSQQLCLPAVFKNRLSATGLCHQCTTTPKIYLSFEIVVFCATSGSILSGTICWHQLRKQHKHLLERVSGRVILLPARLSRGFGPTASLLSALLLLSDYNCSRLHF